MQHIVKNPSRKWLNLCLGIIGTLGIAFVDWYIYGLFKNKNLALILNAVGVLLWACLFFTIAAGSVKHAIVWLKEIWKNIIQTKKGFLISLLILVISGFISNIILALNATEAYVHQGLALIVFRSISYGLANFLAIYAFIKLAGSVVSEIIAVVVFIVLNSLTSYVADVTASMITLNALWFAVIGYGILAKQEGFSFSFALFFYVIVTCDLFRASNTFSVSGVTFIMEHEELNRTAVFLYTSLILGMAYLAHYFYEYAYAYSLPMQEVVQKTKFAYQRTWGGKPLVIAELLPLLKKNRENIKIWTDAVISREDYEMSRRMSADESFYGIHGFENGKWHRFDDGLLRHGEHATSNNDGRFRLNYNWRADRYLIKVIEKDKLYVGIFAIVNTLEEVQSYGKAYNFNAPPNVLSRWTKAPLYFRGQCALLYDISTGEEAYIRYDVINHPDGFRKYGRGFSSKSFYDND